MRRIANVLLAGVLAGLLGGCADSAALKRLDEKTDITNKELGAAQTTLNAACGDVKKVQDSLAELQKTNAAQLEAIEKRLAKAETDAALANKQLADLQKASTAQADAIEKRLAKTETDATLANKQLATFKEDIASFSAKFKEMSSSIAQANALIVKNLENARDIYKTQFLALEEVLQNLKKASEPGEKAPPAEK